VGEGKLDLVMVPGFLWHLEHQWEWPEYAAMLRRLASFSRLILFDKRGTGLSDRVPPAEMPTLEQRMDDLRAVLDACGSERESLLGFWEGGPMSLLFAATYPQRTRALVLYGAPAAFTKAPGYPWAPDAEENEQIERSPLSVSRFAPAFTRANARSLATRSQGLRYTWARESRRRRGRGGDTRLQYRQGSRRRVGPPVRRPWCSRAQGDAGGMASLCRCPWLK
jgi:pimeloyl-ACP methyl ester carboxylesterase